MTLLVFVSIYVGFACFAAGCGLRIRQYSALPVHLRWELYPVPHEAPERAEHGGSYFEESEWWTKKRRFHLAGELRVMLVEILLLKSLWEANRKLWWRSFTFHFGMYTVLASIALSLCGAAYMGRVAGGFGLGMTAVGALALLARRMFNRELHDYTHATDFVQLAAISTISAMVMFGSLSASAPSVRSFVRALGTGQTSLYVPQTLSVGLMLGAVLLAYVPYSQMAHFIGKYFTFHVVRWDDAAMHESSKLVEGMRSNLASKPTWYALHVGADGEKTWADIAAANPAVPEVHS